MQDPSAGMQPLSARHLHLIANYQFPLVAQLSMEQAFRYLIEAPSVVKQLAPMSWTHVSAPSDGTIWLEWMSPAQNGGRYPSDGYVWGDPEQAYRKTINGYTLELLVHQFGFRPGFDHMTAHARTRYHFIAKAPNVNAAPPDPSLWIVHYHHAPQQRILPASQVVIDPYMRHIMKEREVLNANGRIERREFMLHDREHWPIINVPDRMSQSQPLHGRSAMQSHNSTGVRPHAAQSGFPSAKRQRTQAPILVSGMPEPGEPEFSVDEEDYNALGDYFDHLTPREISLTRYQQHHRWMEEVFSSPYASANIVPADLGLGLMGELKGLTDGLLKAPVFGDFEDKAGTKLHPVQEAAFTSIPKEQLEEFNARVLKHIDEGTAEIERMKADHAAKMQEWRKTYKLTQAEGQLRGATWKGHESALFKSSGENTTDYSDSASIAVIEDVIASVEQLVGRKVKSHSNTSLIEKGGLVKEDRPSSDAMLGVISQQQSKAPSVASPDAVSFQRDIDNEQTSNGVAERSESVALAQPERTPPTSQGPSGAEPDLLDESMDGDAADIGFELGHTPGQASEHSGSATAAASTAAAGASGGDIASTLDQQAIPTTADSASSNVGQSSTTAAAHDSATGSAPQQEMFDNSTQDYPSEPITTEDDVGDGLIDFGDEDGIGLDDSAFGDALHGMDS